MLTLILWTLCGVIFQGGLSEASCNYKHPRNECVGPGEEAVYEIEITNNDFINYLAGVTVRTEVSQDISDYHLDHETIHLEINETKTITLTVYTEGISAAKIETRLQHYEKGDTEDEESESHHGDFETTIDHSQSQDTGGKETEDNFPLILIIAGAGFSVGAVMVFTVDRSKWSSVPLLGMYSKLKREKILENPARMTIYEILCQQPGGATLTQLQRATGYEHKSYLIYHLRKLMEHGYLRRSGKLYFVPALQRSEMNGSSGAPTPGPQSGETPFDTGDPTDGNPDERDYHSEYYGKNRERMIETQKNYYDRNRKKRRQYQREYYHKKKNKDAGM